MEMINALRCLDLLDFSDIQKAWLPVTVPCTFSHEPIVKLSTICFKTSPGK